MIQKILIPLLCAIGLLLVVGWMSNLFNDRVEPGVLAKPENSVRQSFPVIVKKVPIREAVPGTIVAKQATEISYRILARIQAINVRAGDHVKEGDLLVQLEQSDLQSRKAQATEQIKGIRARLDEARLQHDRIAELFDQGMVALSERDKTKATMEALQAELTQAEQLYKEMDTALSYSAIRAPIDGRIIDRFAEPGDTASPGDKLLSLYNPLSLRVEAYVREQLALGIRIGDPLSIEVPSLNRDLPGRIEEIVPAANAGARSFRIHVLMDYSADMLPGMFARLMFELDQEERILIPTDIIIRVGQLDIVSVLSAGGPQRRVITAGKTYGSLTEVLTGLNRNERLLTPQPWGTSD